MQSGLSETRYNRNPVNTRLRAEYFIYYFRVFISKLDIILQIKSFFQLSQMYFPLLCRLTETRLSSRSYFTIEN